MERKGEEVYLFQGPFELQNLLYMDKTNGSDHTVAAAVSLSSFSLSWGCIILCTYYDYCTAPALWASADTAAAFMAAPASDNNTEIYKLKQQGLVQINLPNHPLFYFSLIISPSLLPVVTVSFLEQKLR